MHSVLNKAVAISAFIGWMNTILYIDIYVTDNTVWTTVKISAMFLSQTNKLSTNTFFALSRWLISIIFTCNIDERYIGNFKKTLQYPSSYTPRLLSHMTILNIEAGTHLDMWNDYQKMYEVNFRML